MQRDHSPPFLQDSGNKLFCFNEIWLGLRSKYMILLEFAADYCWIRSYMRFGGYFWNFLSEKDTMGSLCAKRVKFYANGQGKF